MTAKRKKGSWAYDYHHVLEPGEVKRLIQASNRRFGSLIAFLYLTGCRINEALRVKRGDIAITPESVLVDIGYSKRGDRAKAQKHTLEFSLQSPFANCIVAFASLQSKSQSELQSKMQSKAKLQSKDALVWGNAGKKELGYWDVWSAFDSLSRRTGLRVTPHTFRHTRATKLAKAGATMHQLMMWHGWKRHDTAEHYLEEVGAEARKLRDKVE